MENFLNKFFGFVKQKKSTPNQYQRFDVGDDFGDDFKALAKKNRELLTLNGVNLNKIKFIFTPTFHYDLDNNVVNPQFTMMIPLRNDGSNLFDNNAPVVEIGKPKNLVMDSVRSYKVDDNYVFLKELTKKSKRGIVIYIIEHQDAVKLDGTLFSYEFGVDSEELRLRDLDELGVETEDCEQIL